MIYLTEPTLQPGELCLLVSPTTEQKQVCMHLKTIKGYLPLCYVLCADGNVHITGPDFLQPLKETP